MNQVLLEQKVARLEAASGDASTYVIEGGGTTSDITAAIAAAQAAGQKHVHLGDGTWTVDCGGLSDSRLVITVPSGFKITGNGTGRTIIYVTNTTTGAGLDGVSVFGCAEGTTDVDFDGLHFKGTNGTSIGTFSYVLNNQNSCITVLLVASKRVVVRNCTFEFLWGFSVHCPGDCESVHVLDCTSFCCANGINVNANNSLQCRNDISYSEGFEAGGRGVIVAQNIIRNGYGVGVTIGGAQTLGVSFPANIVSGNTIDTISDGAGITITDSADATNCSNNIIRKCDRGGIIVSHNVNAPVGCIIIGNTLESNCKDPGANLVGLDIRSGSRHLIFGNIAVDLGVPGYAQAYGMSLTVPDCVVFGNYFDGTSADLQIDSGASDTREAGNTFANNTFYWLGTAARKSNAITAKAATDVIETSRLSLLSALDARAYFARLADGTLQWGNNLDPLDTTLYRDSAGVLKTDGQFVAASHLLTQDKVLAVNGLGVGNSAAASVAVGTLVKKIQVFDENGNSLGYVPVYSSIT